VVALAADHGEEFFDHGHMFHGQTVYGELSNVPLIFWGPGRVPPGVVVPDTVQGIDLMPTLLELSGWPIRAGVQGRSLKPYLAAGAERPAVAARPAFTVKAATRDVFGPVPRDTESYAVVSGGWKLVHNVKRPAGAPELELYDHTRDPLDQTDVAAGHPDVVAGLSRLLADWRRKAESQRLPSDAEAARGLSNEELERLRSLGYIQ
jgi:arylsulfatase A-like enzyme